MKFGIAIAARMPMIATTIISSMRVNPFMSFFICTDSFGLRLVAAHEFRCAMKQGERQLFFPRGCAGMRRGSTFGVTGSVIGTTHFVGLYRG